jgi:EF-P beta-lysylation protein EpmB
MRKGDPDDPLLRQVLPVGAELDAVDGFRTDPVGDAGAALAPGLLHKYQGRALLVATGACAVHCRYCFRRHFPYSETPRSAEAWRDAIDLLSADTSIDEVILSGGDPWTLADDVLADLINRLAEIPHIARVRVHSRLPIMIPSRVTDGLMAGLTDTRLTPIVVVHANHARELNDEVASALGRLSGAGVSLLNQAVLLRGVNDTAEAQVALCRRLVELRVMPYYLHQLDRVEGAAHFEVAVDQGRAIIAAMRRELPGYAVPRYVQETAGAPHKIVLA